MLTLVCVVVALLAETCHEGGNAGIVRSYARCLLTACRLLAACTGCHPPHCHCIVHSFAVVGTHLSVQGLCIWLVSLVYCCRCPISCSVWGSKVSAWSSCHGILSSRQPLAFSLLFSSVASLMGSAGQANYAAANAALDAAAAADQACGLSSCSVRWGAWAGAGMASSAVVRAKVASLGMGMVQPASGLAALERLLASSTVSAAVGLQVVQGAPVVDVVPFRWGRLLHRYQKLPDLFSVVAAEWTEKEVAGPRDAPTRPRGGVAALSRVPGAAHSTAVAADNVVPKQQLLVRVKEAISDVIGREVSADEPLMAAGLDSLGAVELRNTLERSLNISLPATVTFDHPSAAAIAHYVATKLQTAPRPPAAGTPYQAPAVADDFGFGFTEVTPHQLQVSGTAPAQLTTTLTLQQVQQEVSDAVALVLGNKVASDAALMASGLDSLGSVELHNVLQDRFAVVLPGTLVSG
eukprot:GHUV01045827.1.p1 GENE.GHUV01045827.1~~GHUV01045827.1.p1  ORF type:complete len:465 (+),score=138.43 GHUV01045827.1:195-1589(+)